MFLWWWWWWFLLCELEFSDCDLNFLIGFWREFVFELVRFYFFFILGGLVFSIRIIFEYSFLRLLSFFFILLKCLLFLRCIFWILLWIVCIFVLMEFIVKMVFLILNGRLLLVFIFLILFKIFEFCIFLFIWECENFEWEDDLNECFLLFLLGSWEG